MADDRKSERDSEQNHQQSDYPNHLPKTLLIAHVRAHLVSGEAFDLLPIKHEQDVKTEVSALIESWSKSGFLLRGRFVYPWHQVKQIEITSIEELPLRLAEQRFDDLYAAERARTQEDFWRTKQKSSDSKDGGKDDKKEGGKSS
ncbi:MAG: hypothetical protein ACR2JE_13265 [Acidobacteriaceae bacterium]